MRSQVDAPFPARAGPSQLGGGVVALGELLAHPGRRIGGEPFEQAAFVGSGGDDQCGPDARIGVGGEAVAHLRRRGGGTVGMAGRLPEGVRVAVTACQYGAAAWAA